MANTARKDRKRLATTDERHPTKKSAPKPRAKRKRNERGCRGAQGGPAQASQDAGAESHACRPRAHSRRAERRKCGARRAENSLAASHSDAGDCHPTDGRAAFRAAIPNPPNKPRHRAARPPRRRRRD